MKGSIHFSSHAFERVLQRTKLSPFDIAKIIDVKACIDLGSKPGILKRHVLFYSTVDSAFFVAIQDVIDGTIITLLPLEYHDNLAWPVAEEQKQAAIVLSESSKPYEQGSEITLTQPNTLFVTIHFMSNDTYRSKILLKKKVELCTLSAAQVFEHVTRNEIENAIDSCGINKQSISVYSLKFGKSGSPLYFSYQPKTSSK